MPQKICHFYQQGNCKFGDRCKFSHDDGYNYGNYSQQRAPPQQQQANQYRWKPASQKYESKGLQQQESNPAAELVAIIIKDVMEWEKSKQWPFSVYAYEREGACLDGFSDVSPEEMRSEAYQAQKDGQFSKYESEVLQYKKEWQEKVRLLQNPDVRITQVLQQEIARNISQKSAADSSSPAKSSPAAGFSFLAAAGKTSNSQAGTTAGSFANFSNQPPTQLTTFGSQQPAQPLTFTSQQPAQPATFGSQQLTQPTTHTQPATFSNQQPAQQAVTFSNQQPAQPMSFANQQAASSSFAPPPSQHQQQAAITSSGQQVPSSFGVHAQAASAFQMQRSDFDHMHTDMVDLTEEQKEQFAADKFTFSKIPERPPPKAFCGA